MCTHSLTSASLRRWSCLCLGRLWEGFCHQLQVDYINEALDVLCSLVGVGVPEVRACALFAMGTYFIHPASTELTERHQAAMEL